MLRERAKRETESFLKHERKLSMRESYSREIAKHEGERAEHD